MYGYRAGWLIVWSGNWLESQTSGKLAGWIATWPDSRPAGSRMPLPGRRRLTRDYQNRRLTRDSRISGFFFLKIQKNRKNRFFGLPGPK